MELLKDLSGFGLKLEGECKSSDFCVEIWMLSPILNAFGHSGNLPKSKDMSSGYLEMMKMSCACVHKR